MSEYGEKKAVLSKDKITNMILILIIVAFIGTIGNLVGYGVPIMESLPGMLIILAVAFLGQLLSMVIPIKISYVLYVTIIGIAIANKWSPIAPFVNEYVGKVNMLATSTICLAFAGAGMAKNWAEFKKIGIKGLLVVCFVMFGTFVGSAVISQIVLSMQGLI